MTARRNLPSPLAGEGAARRRRVAGEGAEKLTGTARKLRSRMTDAERKLWFALKDRRFEAFKFRRQVPIERYVVDFLCFDRRFIIEVDGGQHTDSASDAVRDALLRDNGFEVLRFWNNDVLSNLSGVLERISERLNSPSPGVSRSLDATLSRKGRGKKAEIAR